ncbi:MAG: hypothetical protein ABIQ54_01085 [Gammaproteobacteria bacterium]
MNVENPENSKPVFAAETDPPGVDPQLTIDPDSEPRSVERRKLSVLRSLLNRLVNNGLSAEQLPRTLVELRLELIKHYDKAYRAALKYSRLN